jgi:transcriptional regulator with XRE-family HTH domain
MTVRTNIASGLKKARKNAGMNVDEVGAVLGKSGKTISAWEVGRGQPDGDELIILCKLLNVHLKDFYGNEFEDYVAEEESTMILNDEERELIEALRMADDDGKRTILNVARAIARTARTD